MTAGRKGSKHPRRARASERRERWNAGGREEGEEAGEEKGRRGTTEEQQHFSPSQSPARTSARIRRPSTVCQPDRNRTGRTRQNRLKSIPLFKSMQNPLRNDPFSVSIKVWGIVYIYTLFRSAEMADSTPFSTPHLRFSASTPPPSSTHLSQDLVSLQTNTRIQSYFEKTPFNNVK